MPGSWAVVLLSFVFNVHAVYRQHHIAVLQNPSTVLLIGGAALPNNYSQLLDLRKQQTKNAYSTLPVAYHTAVQTLGNETLVLFGATDWQLSNLSAPFWIANNTATIQNATDAVQPPLRYGHTSFSYNESDFVLGGITDDQNVLSDLWQLKNMTWSQVAINSASLAGHSTIVYNDWIVSCFGIDDNWNLQHECWSLDLSTNVSQTLSVESQHHPEPRAWASLTLPTNSTEAILYGGQDDSGDFLDDLWTLDISDLPNSIYWSHVPAGNTTHPVARAGHVALEIVPPQNVSCNILLVHGGEVPNTAYNDSTVQYLDISTLTWISPSIVSQQFNNGSIMLADSNTTNASLSFDQESVTSSKTLGGGAIGGIVIGSLCAVAGAVGLFIVYRRRRFNGRHAAQHNIPKSTELPPSSGIMNLQPLQLSLSEKEDLPYITQPTPVKTHDRRSYFANQFRDSISIKSHSYAELLDDDDDNDNNISVVQTMSDSKPDYSAPRHHVSDKTTDSVIPTFTMNSIAENEAVSKEQLSNPGKKQAPSPLVLTNSRIASMKGSRVSQLLNVPSPGSSPGIDSPQSARIFLSRQPSSKSTGRGSVRSMQWVGYDPSTRYSEGGSSNANLVVKNVRDSVLSSGSEQSLPPQLAIRNSFGDDFKVTWPPEAE
ncbi:hypothetical protein K450DRAFT_232639 [Umbelopsis ramanniana AG]|uniref:Galactose oxidase n=1 Tax=Umbelopsis ramanniana AG TaxID=1314678 RepID=A0AAD5ECC6_UMBRA|nr:uncharacterized protein K450DRAFT_232639 [Umbelopsis ramanniana AG]KAI8581353.1 hypothetical protein K450DRAFT_232639 [Umbelopsis ramanniana AG]